jgi:hypothetical protein
MSEVIEQDYIPALAVPKADDGADDTSPAEVVKFTQRLRYRMVEDLTRGGIKGDDKELRSTLRDMDNSALTQRKLSIEEGNQGEGRIALEAFRKLRDMLGADPFATGQQRIGSPTDGVRLPEVTLVPGEDHQGAQSLNIDDYVSPET